MRENANKIDLSGDINNSATFNVGDLTSYSKDEDEGNKDLRENPLQGLEVNAEQVT